jgi:hypothetical protein
VNDQAQCEHPKGLMDGAPHATKVRNSSNTEFVGLVHLHTDVQKNHGLMPGRECRSQYSNLYEICPYLFPLEYACIIERTKCLAERLPGLAPGFAEGR